MYTVATVIFTVFAIVLGVYTLGMVVKASKPKNEAVCALGSRRMSMAQVIQAIYDYQHILDTEGGLNSRQTATYHGLCAIVGVKPEEL